MSETLKAENDPSLSPKSLSFADVNEWVHHADPCPEYLGWACLSLATALEKETARLTAAEAERDRLREALQEATAVVHSQRVADLEAALALPAGDGWRAIESAPKDGTPIMLGHWFGDVSDSGEFGGDRWLWQASGSIDDEGFWCDFTDNRFLPANYHTATHWKPFNTALPLPSPPHEVTQ